MFLVGLLAARFPRPHGMLAPAFLAQISILSFNLLSPCLLCANLAKQLGPDSIALLWPLVLWGVVVIAIMMALSYFIYSAIGVRDEYKYVETSHINS